MNKRGEQTLEVCRRHDWVQLVHGGGLVVKVLRIEPDAVQVRVPVADTVTVTRSGDELRRPNKDRNTWMAPGTVVCVCGAGVRSRRSTQPEEISP